MQYLPGSHDILLAIAGIMLLIMWRTKVVREREEGGGFIKWK